MRRSQPSKFKLLELKHNQGQVVMQMTWINDGSVWSHLLRPRTWVRAESGLFQQLVAEENMFKEVEVTGLVSKAGTLDMSKVQISPLGTPMGGVSFNPTSSFFWTDR
jgi:hypothetical protein